MCNRNKVYSSSTVLFQKIKTIAMSCSNLGSRLLNYICFRYRKGNLDQGLVEGTTQTKARGRFNIGAYAKAKRIAKEKANSTALAKSQELTKVLDSCRNLEDKISAAKVKVQL